MGNRGDLMTAEELMQLGPLAVVLIVLAREVISVWKWNAERADRNDSEKHADDVRSLVTTVREDLATARTGLASLVGIHQNQRDGAEELWRRLYQELANQVHDENEERAERLATIAINAAEALEAATVVIEAALERLGDDDDS